MVVDRRAEILTSHLLNKKQWQRTSKLRDVTQCACTLLRVYQNPRYHKPYSLPWVLNIWFNVVCHVVDKGLCLKLKLVVIWLWNLVPTVRARSSWKVFENGVLKRIFRAVCEEVAEYGSKQREELHNLYVIYRILLGWNGEWCDGACKVGCTKNLRSISNFRRQRGWWRMFHTENPQILGSTGQNLVTTFPHI
jgi:hypothetical protein